MSVPTVLFSSVTDEWFTPAALLDLARTLLETIDLDPASCAEANQRVRAARYITRAEDGLGQDWSGRVWLNPPYGRGGQELWSRKLMSCYYAGSVTEALLLVNAQTSERWFQPLWGFPLCFIRGRVRFERPDGTRGMSPTKGSAVAFLASSRRWGAFTELFSSLGHVVLPRLVGLSGGKVAMDER